MSPARPSCSGARWPVVLVTVLALVLAACGGDEEEVEESVGDEAGGIHLVATTSILGDVLEELAQGDAAISVIMPPGADPHGFEPSAADGRLLREADLVVANGLDLEENLVSMLEAAEEEGVRVLRLAEHLDPIAFDWDGPGHGHEEADHGHEEADHGHEEADHGHEEADHGHGHDHDAGDPHVWFDPVRMAEGVRLIAEEIADLDEGLGADAWRQRADEYGERLLEVHGELEAMFATIPDDARRLVTNHDALGYLAARYDFEVVGTVIPGASTQAEADPRGFAELVETVEGAGVPAVFAENTDSARLAEQLRDEVVGRGDLEVEVVRIHTDALGEPGSGAETYLGLLRETGSRITEALGGSV